MLNLNRPPLDPEDPWMHRRMHRFFSRTTARMTELLQNEQQDPKDQTGHPNAHVEDEG